MRLRRPQGILAVTVSLATLVPTGASGQVSELTDVGRVVRTLAALEPQDLQGLEAVLGPLNRDTSLWEEAAGSVTRQQVSPGIGRVRVDFDIDLYHQEPREVANPRLASYEIVALVGDREAEEILKDRLGKPRRIRVQGRSLLGLGRFFLDPFGDGGFRLLWYAEEPDFAIAPRPRGVEERLVRDLVALVGDGFPRERIERRLGRLEREPDAACEILRQDSWEMDACPAGAEIFDRITFRFRPALPAEELARAMGVEDPVAVSTDVHQTTRVLADRQGTYPSVRGYAVDVAIRNQELEPLDEPVGGLPAWKGASGLAIEGLSLDRQPPGR